MQKITYSGATKSLSKWAKELNIPYTTLVSRMKSGLSFEEAIDEVTRRSRSTKLNATELHSLNNGDTSNG